MNLLHTLANATASCVVLLTGDYHYADLKVARPGQGSAYADMLASGRLAKNVFQAMASGMTTSTARYTGQPCEGSYREDLVGLRPLGRCGSRGRTGAVSAAAGAAAWHCDVILGAPASSCCPCLPCLPCVCVLPPLWTSGPLGDQHRSTSACRPTLSDRTV